MILKVCGIRDQHNLKYLTQSDVDMIGFIFYPQSKRFFDEGNVSTEELSRVSRDKVGVFVNASIEEVLERVKTYGLTYAQLHGDESPAFCREIRRTGVKVMKAFAVEDRLPEGMLDYLGCVDLFLFDTKGAGYGGTGRQFDWSVLDSYDLEVPFLLSGGIGPGDVAVLQRLELKKMIGIDINSRFEKAPGLKDEALLEEFIKAYKKKI
jgi:phosphoribosylanthranilate isomerase